MSFEKLILAIIVFNVITGLIGRARKKRLEAEAARNGGPEPKTEGMSAQNRYAEEEEEEEDLEEETVHMRRRQEEMPPPAVSTKTREKVSHVGRDVLEQIAKELGLNIPKEEKQPAPIGPATREEIASKTKPAPVNPMARKTLMESRETLKPMHQEGWDGNRYRRRDQEALSALAEEQMESPASLDMGRIYQGLSDPQSLRETFVLKTILDLPVSRQGGRKGMRFK